MRELKKRGAVMKNFLEEQSVDDEELIKVWWNR